MEPFLSPLLGFALVLLIAFAVVRLRAHGQVVIAAWEQGLLYRDGAFVRLLPPGRHRTGFTGEAQVLRVTTVARQTLVPLQEVLTVEGFSVKLGAVVTWSVTDARRFQETTLGQGEERLRIAVQLALRHAAQTRGIDALLAAREELGGEILAKLRDVAAAIGVTVEAAALRDLALPAELRRMLTETERAKREGAAALERARAEQATLRSLANAARLMRGNPELSQLRLLQALQAAPGKAAPTLVFGASVLPLRPGEAPDAAAPGLEQERG